MKITAIIWTNDGILLMGTIGTIFSEILSGIETFSLKKCIKNVVWKVAAILSEPQCVKCSKIVMYIVKVYSLLLSWLIKAHAWAVLICPDRGGWAILISGWRGGGSPQTEDVILRRWRITSSKWNLTGPLRKKAISMRSKVMVEVIGQQTPCGLNVDGDY